MMEKEITLRFVNKGRPFRIPTRMTPGLYKKLLEINAEAEKTYKHLQGTKQYENLVSMKSNIDTAYYILHNIDSNVTLEDIENWDDPHISMGEFILMLYSSISENNEDNMGDKKKDNAAAEKNSKDSTSRDDKSP